MLIITLHLERRFPSFRELGSTFLSTHALTFLFICEAKTSFEHTQISAKFDWHLTTNSSCASRSAAHYVSDLHRLKCLAWPLLDHLLSGCLSWFISSSGILSSEGTGVHFKTSYHKPFPLQLVFHQTALGALLNQVFQRWTFGNACFHKHFI